MPICPKCKKEIEELIYIESGYKVYTCYYSDLMKGLKYDEEEYEADDVVMEYKCPECNEVLFTDCEKALEFLKYNDELSRLISNKLKKVEKNGKL